jgi:hypothetical protein
MPAKVVRVPSEGDMRVSKSLVSRYMRSNESPKMALIGEVNKAEVTVVDTVPVDADTLRTLL